MRAYSSILKEMTMVTIFVTPFLLTSCPTLEILAPFALIPSRMMMTFGDLHAGMLSMLPV
jgi:hypothetical protein